MFRRNTPPPLKGLSVSDMSEAEARTDGYATGSTSWKTSEPTSPGGLSTASFRSSFSWVAGASTTELVTLLKNAYSSLREKERDLALAAEIGKSLLDNNMSLKTKYEGLLRQIQQYEGRATSSTVNDGLVMTPREDDAQSETRFIPHQLGREAMIEALERKNMEMQSLLDNAVAESEAAEQANEKRIRTLQREIDLLRSNLDSAAQKIQELEESKTRHPDHSRTTTHSEVDETLLQELTERMHRMQCENEDMSMAKRALEEKLAAALRDLDGLRSQFESFEFTQQGLAQLQDAYQQQFRHIDELSQNLEEHRNTLARLRDRGVSWSPHSSPAPSEFGDRGHSTLSSSTLQDLRMTTPKQSLLGELENAWLKKLGTSADTAADHTSLDSGIQSDPTAASDSPSLSLTLSRMASLTEHNLASFYSAPASYAVEALLSTAGVKDCALVTEAVRLLDRPQSEKTGSETDLFAPGSSASVYSSYNLYPRAPSDMCSLIFNDPHVSSSLWGLDVDVHTPPPKGLVGRVVRIVRCIFRLVWRWCRFAVILATAILINLWHGPEAIMEK